MNSALRLIAVAMVLALCACENSRINSSSEVKTPHRTDFAPEEFGIGRSHTKNPGCNRQIDELLDQIRVCYNGRSDTDCAALQRANSDHIGKLKNSRHCRRSNA